MKLEIKEWLKLKRILLTTAQNVQKNNGIKLCKNCGIDCQDLVEEIEKLIREDK